MRHRAKMFVRCVAGCALVCLAASVSRADTTPILTLNLVGGAGQVAMDGGGNLATLDDGIGTTTGNHNTEVAFDGNLGIFFSDIDTPAASFTLSNLTASGAPTVVFGSLVFQNYVNGTFELYGSDNTLLLSASLSGSTLVGLLGPGTPPTDPASGSIFTSSFNTITGGTLQNYIIGNSVALQMQLSELETPTAGAGFRVDGGVLAPFSANSMVMISGTAVPEPSAAACMLVGISLWAAVRRWRRK